MGSPQTQLAMDEDEVVDMDVDMETDHAGSAARASSPSQLATSDSIPSLISRPPSSSGINQR